MSTLEQEVIDKFHQLQPAAQRRVRALIEREAVLEVEQTAPFDYAAWLADVENIRQQIRANHGDKLPPMDVVGMLRDIRDGEDE